MHQVSRKFVYQQGNRAQQALDETFAPAQADDDVLFHLPVTKNWLYQLILGLVLICHSSYRGVVELLRDLFDTPISVATVHNRLEATAEAAAEINQAEDLYECGGVSALIEVLEEDVALRFARVQSGTTFAAALAHAVADLVEEVAESRNLARF